MTSILSAAKGAFGMIRTPPSIIDMDSEDDSPELEMQREITLWKSRFHRSQRDVDARITANNALQLELEQSKVAYEQLMDQANGVVRQYHRKDAELAHALQVSSEKDRALAHAETQNAELKALLEARTSELSAFQDFAPPTEQVTDVCVAEMVEEINYEIGQTAATLSDDYADVPPSHTEHAKDAFSSLEMRAGRGAAKVLASAGKGLEQDIAIQIALQACMSARACNILNRWSFGSTADDAALKDISKNVSENEPPHVSRKWRSLTHRHARWTRQGRSKAETTNVNHIKQHLADVLVAAGHAPDQTTALAVVYAKVGAHVSEVVRLAFELNEVLGQKLGAYDMHPAHLPYGTTFDPETMQDGYSTAGTGDVEQRRGKVLCTTDLGLVRVMKGREDILVKPKVALDALISPDS